MDQTTGALSLFELVEQLNLHGKLPGSAGFQVLAVIRRTLEKGEFSTSFRLQVDCPDETVLFSQEYTIVVDKASDCHCMRIDVLLAFPMEGTYRVLMANIEHPDVVRWTELEVGVVATIGGKPANLELVKDE